VYVYLALADISWGGGFRKECITVCKCVIVACTVKALNGQQD